jgi:hypothetical protein
MPRASLRSPAAKVSKRGDQGGPPALVARISAQCVPFSRLSSSSFPAGVPNDGIQKCREALLAVLIVEKGEEGIKYVRVDSGEWLNAHVVPAATGDLMVKVYHL